MIANPILRGFHPDPSIIRVGEDYYIATSTFEWWPGVRLHHSKDLEHWELIEYPLDRISQLDLRGVGPSQGIWAPCLTYDHGTFYLVYTIVRSFYCNMYDTENFLVTATDIHGPWSEPVALSNFGFDPSLFHDTDGRKYMVSMVTDHRVPKKYAGRIILQEYDPVAQRMIGEAKDIYTASDIFLEGPHIFKKDGLYYLFCADTGTGEAHGQSILRSKNLWGPYEMKQDPPARRERGEAYSIMTSRHFPEILLQKSGHADLVESPDGEWYMVHLCGRKSGRKNPPDAPRFAGADRYMLGRETAIQQVIWKDDGWPYLYAAATKEVTSVPQTYVAAPVAATQGTAPGAALQRDDFDSAALDLDYQSLRIPMGDTYCSLRARPGWLRMYGRSGLSSLFSQSLIARRMTSYRMEAETLLSFAPTSFKQMAGLILLYDTENYLYLHVSFDEDLGRCLQLLKYENKVVTYLTEPLTLPEGDVVLHVAMRDGDAQFSYRVCAAPQGGELPLTLIGPRIDASFLSDEACLQGWFSGAMIGLCAQDLTGAGIYADFDYFEVKDV
ncbi:MAG: glycoside hydrolase family 43 protein [Lachnospiraceae bacterium]|nr:glycoside hydrolase family 43 protein [Lachnospiraceae bacterium]